MEDFEQTESGGEGYFVPEEIQMYIDQLRKVGPEKPMGYLLLFTLICNA